MAVAVLHAVPPSGQTDHPAAAAPCAVLVASHSHPRVQHGGSEVASHALFERLRGVGGISASYCGCSRDRSFARAGQSITQPFGEDEYLYTVGDFEWFKFANRDTAFPRDFQTLLERLRPDVVHFHHYISFGMEAFAHVRAALPDARIVLTLHEFLAICHQQGQMVTRPHGTLCRSAGYVECGRCFPEIQPADFFIRDIYVRHFLRHVDHFVSPSRFLAERYVAWGLPAERVSVIENVSRTAPAPAPRGTPAAGVLRAGFFGQISSLKGIGVLIDAAALLERDGCRTVSFVIHGDHRNQPDEFQAGFLSRVAGFGSNIAFAGAYSNDEVDALMAQVDVVVVPSVWWENAPVVIQEAFRNGRPVVCSGIGGMAEKVLDGRTGLHVPPGSARALAAALEALSADRALLAGLEAGVARLHPGPEDPLAQHLRLYRALRAASRGPALPAALETPSTGLD